MAEAMCGPANPLQQFKQQTTLDRSLQQDRLASRQNTAQGFRSANPNAGLLDPEFEAFQAGVDINQIQPFHQSGHLSGPSQAPSWATDFQHLAISSPSPFQQLHQPFAAAPETASWAKGFLDNRAELAPRTQSVSPSPQAFQQRARYGLTGYQGSFAQQSFAPSMQSAKGKAPMVEQFDEAAFDRAFDQAREDMMADVTSDNMTVNAPVDMVESTIDERHDLAQPTQQDEFGWKPEHAIHGTDIEHQPVLEAVNAEKEVQRQQADDDALAATAHELLEKIEHNQTDKFKNSQFLGLMRKLRDREVRVEGDKMVETANATSASTTGLADATLNSTSSTPAAPLHGVNKQYSVPSRPNPVITRPHDLRRTIPPGEQDYDSGRTIDPRDGQAVVDLLDQHGPLTDDMGTSDPTHVSPSPSEPNIWPGMSFDSDGFITP